MTEERTAAVDALRATVKGRMNAGWALEAVRRGVAVAKQGNNEGALTYYNKVGGHALGRWMVIAVLCLFVSAWLSLERKLA